MSTLLAENRVVDITTDEELLPSNRNMAEREDWFQNQALGMFIHWGLDCLLGTVPSHWMIGADDRLVKRLIQEVPGWFNPVAFDPGHWATLAQRSGMRYASFSAKHHSGFCMFHTRSNRFNVGYTPYREDITGQYVSAFREKGIAPGLYFSPLDFYWCHQQGKELQFMAQEVVPGHNPGLMDYNLLQIRELMTNYGPIDTLFLDGPPEQVRELAWQLQPEVVISRGAMKTPEQAVPDQKLDGAWEACFTIGDGWSYKPTHDTVKSGTELIELLIRIRALGGNLLLNVTPDPEGRIPADQERVLQELGTWIFFNDEAVYDVRPWHVHHDEGVWYTRSRNSDTVYAYVTGESWPYGHFGRKQICLCGVAATDDSQVEMVGQNGRILEHAENADVKTRWTQTDDGLLIDAMRCYRPYDNRKWPNPVVFRITHAAKV